MGLPELIRLFYADSFLIFGVSIKFGHNGRKEYCGNKGIHSGTAERR